MAAPDFLAIGHVSKDVTPEGHTLGGAVVFGAVTAARMGLSSAIVTSAGPDFDLGAALAGIPVHVVPADATTAFENIDAAGARTQYLHAVAGPIGPSDIPPGWACAPMVFLAPSPGSWTAARFAFLAPRSWRRFRAGSAGGTTRGSSARAGGTARSCCLTSTPPSYRNTTSTALTSRRAGPP